MNRFVNRLFHHAGKANYSLLQVFEIAFQMLGHRLCSRPVRRATGFADRPSTGFF
jgi:hypothetical protein